MTWSFSGGIVIPAANGLTLSRANRTRDRSTYDDEAAVGVGCSVELDDDPVPIDQGQFA
jgi:hypothetical protein